MAQESLPTAPSNSHPRLKFLAPFDEIDHRGENTPILVDVTYEMADELMENQDALDDLNNPGCCGENQAESLKHFGCLRPEKGESSVGFYGWPIIGVLIPTLFPVGIIGIGIHDISSGSASISHLQLFLFAMLFSTF